MTGGAGAAAAAASDAGEGDGLKNEVSFSSKFSSGVEVARVIKSDGDDEDDGIFQFARRDGARRAR